MVKRYQKKRLRLLFRGDAAFAKPKVYEYLEPENIGYVIRIPANQVLQDRNQPSPERLTNGHPYGVLSRFRLSGLGLALTLASGAQESAMRLPKGGVASGPSVSQARIYRHELIYPPSGIAHYYNGRGTAEQWIRESKNAINWTRLSCHSFRSNAVRLQLHALAYDLGNFLRTLALPDEVEHWSLTTLREKLINIGTKVVRHGRYITFQLAEVAVSRALFDEILRLISGLRPRPAPT